MFHNIVEPGKVVNFTDYPIDEFTKIVKAIAEAGYPVRTLSEFDRMNGIPVEDPKIIDKVPSQIEINAIVSRFK
jgi:hypothetical protein